MLAFLLYAWGWNVREKRKVFMSFTLHPPLTLRPLPQFMGSNDAFMNSIAHLN